MAKDECVGMLMQIAPLVQAHGSLVHDLEQRLKNWEGSGGPKSANGRVADILLTHLPPILPVSFYMPNFRIRFQQNQK